MSVLSEQVSNILTTYGANPSEVITMGQLPHSFTSHLTFIVSVVSTLVSILGPNVLGYLVR
jgi:hypothetical protein